MDYAGTVAVITASGALAGSYLAQQVATRLRIPQVLVFLFVGMAVRQFAVNPTTLMTLTKMFMDASLSAMGLQIGSHMNAETLGPIKWPIARFMAVFIPTVLCVVTMACIALVPHLKQYAWLVGSIAIERSSPEALAGIVEAKAAGPVTSMVMCVAAIQDVAALVGFVTASAFLGSGSALWILAKLANATLFSSMAAIVVVNTVLDGRVRPEIQTVLVVVWNTAISYAIDSELLLSAVIIGAVLCYNRKHASVAVVESHNTMVNLTLFTFLGLRINVITYLQSAWLVAGLLAARVLGLWAGTFGGCVFAPFPTHRQTRWMGLVTQLAIALSLVTRMEAAFPESAPLSRACGGVVLCSLLSGPPLLSHFLHRVGEANSSKAGGHVGGEDGAVPASEEGTLQKSDSIPV